MNQDFEIDLTLNVNVKYQIFPAVQGRFDEPDQPAMVEIHKVTAIRKVEAWTGNQVGTTEVNVSWLLTGKDFDSIEARILEEL